MPNMTRSRPLKKKTIRPAPATKPRRSKSATSMSDDAVQAKTGKAWPKWFSILDKAGAKKMTHKEIVAHLVKHHNVGPWWQQMVTVEYEKSRGLRQTHERPDGYSISRSKTINVPLSQLYKAWTDTKLRGQWYEDKDFTIRSATANKYLRITWHDGKTNVETNFYAKGAGKSQVTVQHNKLPNAAAGQRMKKYWGAQLDRLNKTLSA